MATGEGGGRAGAGVGTGVGEPSARRGGGRWSVTAGSVGGATGVGNENVGSPLWNVGVGAGATVGSEEGLSVPQADQTAISVSDVARKAAL
jgi:hypothetical protein